MELEELGLANAEQVRHARPANAPEQDLRRPEVRPGCS